MKSKKRWSVIAALLFICICGIFSIRTGKKPDSVRLPDGSEQPAQSDRKNQENDSGESPVPSESSGDDEEKSTTDTGGAVKDADEAADADSVKETASVVVVHVCGAVQKAGVYELPAGARVADAIEAAGGVTEDAAGEYLNQAEKLTDGSRIYVPDREEAEKLFGTGAAGLWPGNQTGQTNFTGTQGTEETSEPVGQGTVGSGAAGGKSGGSGKVNLNRASREELMSLPGIGESKADAIIAYRQEHGKFKKIEDLMKISGIKEGVFRKIEEFVTVE